MRAGESPGTACPTGRSSSRPESRRSSLIMSGAGVGRSRMIALVDRWRAPGQRAGTRPALVRCGFGSGCEKMVEYARIWVPDAFFKLQSDFSTHSRKSRRDSRDPRAPAILVPGTRTPVPNGTSSCLVEFRRVVRQARARVLVRPPVSSVFGRDGCDPLYGSRWR